MADRMIVSLKQIRRDGGTQIRCSLDRDYVQELRALYGEPPAVRWPDDLDPGTGFLDEEAAIWLADGFHRYEAAEEAGIEEVPIIIIEGTRRDAILYACGANEKHGKRRTREDRVRAVQTILADPEWSKESINWIAQKCVIDWSTAKAIVEQIRGKTSKVKVTRSGKTYEQNTSQIGKKEDRLSSGFPEDAPRPKPIAEEPEDEKKSSPVEEPAPQPEQHVTRDCLGIICQSDEAEEAFFTLIQFDMVENALRSAARLVNELARSPGAEMYAHRHLGCKRGSKSEDRYTSADVTNALKELLHWKPFASVCPFCHAKGKANAKDCEFCYGLPYVIESTFKIAPEEMQEAVRALAR